MAKLNNFNILILKILYQFFAVDTFMRKYEEGCESIKLSNAFYSQLKAQSVLEIFSPKHESDFSTSFTNRFYSQ